MKKLIKEALEEKKFELFKRYILKTTFQDKDTLLDTDENLTFKILDAQVEYAADGSIDHVTFKIDIQGDIVPERDDPSDDMDTWDFSTITIKKYRNQVKRAEAKGDMEERDRFNGRISEVCYVYLVPLLKRVADRYGLKIGSGFLSGYKFVWDQP